MPFKSRSQIKKFGSLVRQGKISKAGFRRWLRETPDPDKLPERVKRAKKPAKRKGK